MTLSALVATALLASRCTRESPGSPIEGPAETWAAAALTADGGMGGGMDAGTTAPDAGDAGMGAADGGDGGVNPPPAGLCWPAAFTIYFNPSLDPALDPAVNDMGRLNDVIAAAADWNNALANAPVNSQVRITIVNTAGAQIPATAFYAADWDATWLADGGTTPPVCTDVPNPPPPPAWPVYDRNFLAPDGHHPNGWNTASFSHWGVLPMPGGPGWTLNNRLGGGGGGGSYYPSPDGGIPTDVLAETQTNPAVGPGFLTEADIVFHTHYQPAFCKRIPWFWNPDPMIGIFDFRTVARHELGHALGLGHLTDPTNVITNNVMQPMIAPNQVQPITNLEINALQQLYGPGKACP